MNNRCLLLPLLMAWCAGSGWAGQPPVCLPSRAPLVTFRILFRTGSAEDPPGKEGLASLTAAMLAKGGSRAMTYGQIVEAMYPLATSFDWQVDKEMTVFYGTTHRDHLERYYGLIRSMLLEPGFRADDFSRLRTDAENELKVTLREGNDEELGKEELYNVLYAGHPYGHHNLGRVTSLERLTLDDVRDFYRQHYLRATLQLGLAGGFPADFPPRMEQDFAGLPAGSPPALQLPTPRLGKGLRVEILQRETRATAISLGFPLDVRRGDPDWPALALAISYLGQHRSSNSHLYQRLREARGLNYGDYAYLEYFPRGMFQFQPDPNLGRRQQIFQIWIRPVEPQNAGFALRAALFEYQQLVRHGLSREAFEATREFLAKYANILLQTQDARLGYALDSRFYGIGDFDSYLRESLARLTLAGVNRAIRRHLRTDRIQAVMVTADAAGLKAALLRPAASAITYNAPKPAALLADDRVIARFRLNLKADDVVITPTQRVFE
jgi:zinc protease